MFSPPEKTINGDKIANLYKTRDWADCIFVFEDEKIPAHKLILTCSSPVFESMFFGSMASAEIHISDIEAEDFKQVLEFIYTSSVNITSVTNAWALFYISQKYFLNDLKNVCIDYIGFNLTLSTLLLSYEYAELYDVQELVERCWRDILLSAKEVLKLDYHMQASTFCSLLDENEINASEKDLIEAAIKWSEEECLSHNKEATKENKLAALIKAGIFPRLRFASLGRNSCHYLHQLLPSSENVPDYVSLVNSNTESRLRLPYQIRYRFRETYKIEQNILLFEGNEFHCVITPARSLVAYGIAITPPHQDGFNAACSDAVVSVFAESRLLCEARDFVKVTSDYENPHLVNFKDGIRFEACKPYRISVKYLSSANMRKPNELLCFYLDPRINTHANSMTLCFEDEPFGGVIRGISYYVL